MVQPEGAGEGGGTARGGVASVFEAAVGMEAPPDDVV